MLPEVYFNYFLVGVQEQTGLPPNSDNIIHAVIMLGGKYFSCRNVIMYSVYMLYSIYFDRGHDSSMPINSLEESPNKYPFMMPVSNLVTSPTSTLY